MRNPDSLPSKLLVAYYGLIQTAHIVVIARAGILLLQTGVMVFPAAPPPDGWSAQAQAFLIGTGAVDALNVLVTWVFVYAYFTRSRYRFELGILVLTVSNYSAILFACGTIPSGAWMHHPVDYFSLAAVYAPVLVLTLLFCMWGIKDRFGRDAAALLGEDDIIWRDT